MSQKDFLIAFLITLAFAITVFYRLGSLDAPESPYTATNEIYDIVLDFGEIADISHLCIYPGPPDNRPLSVSALDAASGHWKLISAQINLDPVFTWERIDIMDSLRFLGLAAPGDRTVIMEMIVITADGNLITPDNADEYPGLFDEQESFAATHAPTYFEQMMFDEIYHGRTAYEFIHDLPIYETTHPPLGKALISLGIRLFGMNPFGWRFMSAVFGILLVPLIYIFAKGLFGNTLAAASAAILVAADNMHLALSRIATIDIFAAFFIVLMYYLFMLYIKKDRKGLPDLVFHVKYPWRKNNSRYALPQAYIPLAICGIAMGVGIAIKWTCVYAGAGLGLLFLWYLINHYPIRPLRLIAFCAAFFIAAPLAIYVLSYIPFAHVGEGVNLIAAAINNAFSMLSYHSGLVATHYYATSYYDWPTLRMPLLYATDHVGELVSSVSCMGNPFIWWTGIGSVLFLIFRFLIKKDLRAGFLVLGYLAQYVPWFFIGRVTFIYHYFPSSLFMILMTAYVLHLVQQTWKKGRFIVYGYLALAVIVFFIFYPVTSGFATSFEYQAALRLLPEWILVL